MLKNKIFVLAALLLSMTVVSVSAQERGDGWPPANILKAYGIEGIPQPVGAKNVWWRIMPDGYGGSGFFDIPVLYIGVEGTSSTEQAVKNWFSLNGWTPYSDGSGSMRRYTKSNARAGHDFSNIADGGSNAIIAGLRKIGTWPGNTVWGRFGITGLTAPPGAVIGEVRDDGNELSFDFYSGGNAAYVNLRNQFIRIFGQPFESEGDDRSNERSDSFWNDKTQVAVYIGREGETLFLRAEKH